MMDIQRIVKGIAGLKPIPHVVNKIMAITQDPDSSMAQLAEVISFDAMATANLLKAANSAYYGCSKKFDSIRQAIVFLGMEEVVDLVLMTSSAENLKRPQAGYGMTAGGMNIAGVYFPFGPEDTSGQFYIQTCGTNAK